VLYTRSLAKIKAANINCIKHYSTSKHNELDPCPDIDGH
jgi:hypothetical protein